MLYLILFILSIILTLFVKQYTKKKDILDIPNFRSSHSAPTPKGGGLAIIITFYVGISYLYFISEIDQKLFFLLFSSAPIMITGLIDDVVMVEWKIRILIQLICSILAVYILGGINSIDFLLFELNGWWLNIFVVITIIWFTNLYNFLDGIDGYAASQSIIAGFGSFILTGSPIGLLIAICSIGFLFFNWPKASIFMGDVGSTTLGFLFAVSCFYDTSSGGIYVWLILLSFFWFDATYTIVKRYLNKEQITVPHKKHLYQRLLQSGLSNKKILFFLIFFNIIFIFLLKLLPIYTYPYLFLGIIVFLFFLVKQIDKKKAFDK